MSPFGTEKELRMAMVLETVLAFPLFPTLLLLFQPAPIHHSTDSHADDCLCLVLAEVFSRRKRPSR